MTVRQDLRDLTFDELVAFMQDTLGEKRFRAQQVFEWLYVHGATRFDDMTNLAKPLRDRLAEVATIEPLALTAVARAEDGTEKLQFTLADGYAIESVLIPNEDRATLCISSQVGCAMCCAFCYTGSLHLTRSLRAGEIVDQYRGALRHLGGDHARISNVVLMGMGEPLANLDAVIRATDLLMHERAYNLSARKVCVSTCGLVPELGELIRRSNVSLAVSLNATTDEVRSRLMPVNRRYPLAELLAVLDTLPPQRRKRLVLEYVLLNGINDTNADAKRLIKIARRLGAKVNLIPFNTHDHADFAPPPPDRVLAFQRPLIEADIPTLIRQSRGQEVHGACGMLGKTTA